MKRNVNWRKYFNKESAVVKYYVEQYGDKFLHQCIVDIKDAKAKRKNSIDLIKFKDPDIVSTVHQTEYDEVLNSIFNLCIYYEFYELCSILYADSKILNKL